MKLHEETWTVAGDKIDGHTFGPWRVFDGSGHLLCTVGDGCSNPDAAKLVSAAPEMASLLLDVEWHGRYEDRVGEPRSGCVSCACAVGESHSAWCELDAILKKAGVR